MDEDANDVAQVGLGVEPVQAAGGDEGEEVRGRVGVDVAADEQPRLATDGDAAQSALARVVVDAQAPVVEVAAERGALAHDCDSIDIGRCTIYGDSSTPFGIKAYGTNTNIRTRASNQFFGSVIKAVGSDSGTTPRSVKDLVHSPGKPSDDALGGWPAGQVLINTTAGAPDWGFQVETAGLASAAVFRSLFHDPCLINSITFSATPTFDFALSKHHNMGAMTANVTSITLSNICDGGIYTIQMFQDGTGGRTVTWPSSPVNVKFEGSDGSAGSAANAVTVWTFRAEGTTLLRCISRKAFTT